MQLVFIRFSFLFPFVVVVFVLLYKLHCKQNQGERIHGQELKFLEMIVQFSSVSFKENFSQMVGSIFVRASLIRII